jgi:hypothetical protein
MDPQLLQSIGRADRGRPFLSPAIGNKGRTREDSAPAGRVGRGFERSRARPLTRDPGGAAAGPSTRVRPSGAGPGVRARIAHSGAGRNSRHKVTKWRLSLFGLMLLAQR